LPRRFILRGNHRRSLIPFTLTASLRGCRAYENHRGSTASEYNTRLLSTKHEWCRKAPNGPRWDRMDHELSPRREYALSTGTLVEVGSRPAWHGTIINGVIFGTNGQEWRQMESQWSKNRQFESRSHVEWISSAGVGSSRRTRSAPSLVVVEAKVVNLSPSNLLLLIVPQGSLLSVNIAFFVKRLMIAIRNTCVITAA